MGRDLTSESLVLFVGTKPRGTNSFALTESFDCKATRKESSIDVPASPDAIEEVEAPEKQREWL